MPIEIEKKYRVTPDECERIINELQALGADDLGAVFEENIIYTGQVIAGAIVRIRNADSRSVLTFKRRIERGLDVKQQIEHETEVSDAAATDVILRECGLKPFVIYEKRRRTWRFRGVEIVVDELPFGWFIEIEGPLTAIREAEMLLGADGFIVESHTYPQMVMRLGVARGGVTESRFSQ